jgi:hypothetical protein
MSEGSSINPSWISLGLGVVEFGMAHGSAGSNGVHINGGQDLSYVVGKFPGRGNEATRDVVMVDVQGGVAPGFTNGLVMPCKARVSLSGMFAQHTDDDPPELRNIRLIEGPQEGNWGTSDHESELVFDAQGLKELMPGSTPEDPILGFQCRLELKIAEGDNVIFTFVLKAQSNKHISYDSIFFDYGQCDVSVEASTMFVTYVPDKHGDKGNH